MSSPDAMFRPLVSDAEVARQCAEAADVHAGDRVPDVVMHALVVRRVTTLADPHAIDGPIGRFIRTGEVDTSPATRIWWPLYGPMADLLSPGAAAQAAALSDYLTAHAGRGPVADWPCAPAENPADSPERTAS